MSIAKFYENKSSFWIRWIAAFPVALLLSWLSAWLTVIIFNLISFRYKQNIPVFIMPAIATGVAGWTFVKVGTELSPKYKLLVGWLFSALMIVVKLILLWVLYDYQEYNKMVIEIGAIIGATAALYTIIKENDRDSAS